MKRGRVMNEDIRSHVHSETGCADAGRVDINEHKTIRRRIRGQLRGLEVNFIGGVQAQRGLHGYGGGSQITVHGIAAKFIHFCPIHRPERTISRTFVNLHSSEVGGEERIVGPDQILHIQQSLRIPVVASVDPERLGQSHGLAAVENQPLAVVAGIHGPGQNHLFLIVHTLDAAGRVFRLRERGQEQRGENGDDRNDNQKFDEGECRPGAGSLNLFKAVP